MKRCHGQDGNMLFKDDADNKSHKYANKDDDDDDDSLHQAEVMMVIGKTTTNSCESSS